MRKVEVCTAFAAGKDARGTLIDKNHHHTFRRVCLEPSLDSSRAGEDLVERILSTGGSFYSVIPIEGTLSTGGKYYSIRTFKIADLYASPRLWVPGPFDDRARRTELVCTATVTVT